MNKQYNFKIYCNKFLPFVVLFVLPIFLLGCNRKLHLSTKAEVITISDDQYDKFDFVVTDVIGLKTSPFFFNRIDDIIIRDGYITAHGFHEGIIMIFNTKGDLIKKLNLGKGPGELLSPSYICYHNNTLKVLDYFKLHSYSLSGEYLETTNLPFGLGISALTFTDFSTVLTYGYGPPISNFKGDENLLKNDLSYLNKKIRVIKTYSIDFSKELETGFYIPEEMSAFVCRRPFSNSTNEILFVDALNDEIYLYNSSGFSLKYKVDFENLKLTENDKKKGWEYCALEMEKGNRIGRLDNIIETNKYISFTCAKKRIISQYIYAKDKKITANISSILRLKSILQAQIVNVYRDKLIMVVYPEHFSQLEFDQFCRRLNINILFDPNSSPLLLFMDFFTKGRS